MVGLLCLLSPTSTSATATTTSPLVPTANHKQARKDSCFTGAQDSSRANLNLDKSSPKDTIT